MCFRSTAVTKVGSLGSYADLPPRLLTPNFLFLLHAAKQSAYHDPQLDKLNSNLQNDYFFRPKIGNNKLHFRPTPQLAKVRKSKNNKIQNPQRSQRTRPKKSKAVSVLHVSRFTHTTRQQNQNPQKSLSRLDLLLSFHRNKPKVELSMPCVLTCLSFFPARANLLVKRLMGILLKTSETA